MKNYFLGDLDIPEEIVPSFGGKASKLHELKKAGFEVPAGFILFSKDEDLSGLVDKIGGFPVAVRSSGAMEDLANASFAGLYETILFVNSDEELRAAIEKCFDSSKSERVKDYLNTKKIAWTPETLRMSVLVQKMVDAEIAGVLFTLNPLNGFEEECYLELCQGVGERLVSGHITPSQIRFNWKTSEIISETINNERTNIPKASLIELIDQSIKIQAFYGHPQDIEWAIDKNQQLFILQSRPVTSYSLRDDRPELTNADFKDGGVSARVCTPAMFAIYRDALQVSMGEYFQKIKLIKTPEVIQWIHYCYGRVYWNAGAVKEGLKNIPGYKEIDFDRDLGIQKNYGLKGYHETPTNPVTIVKAIPILLSLYREFSDCEAMSDQFHSKFEVMDEELKEKFKTLKSFSNEEFNQWFMEVIIHQLETERAYFRTIYNNSNFQTEFKSFLKKIKGYEFGDEMDLMSNLQGVSHLDVQNDLGKLSKIANLYGLDSQKYFSEREVFLKSHYHHGPAELDLTVARWGENKAWVDELVKNYSYHPHGKDMFTPTFERLLKKAGFLNKKKLKNMTERTRSFLRRREVMRAFSTRAYYLLRQGLLEFARRNNLSDKDVFLFDIQEIRKKVLEPNYCLPDITLRRLAYEGYRNFTPPNEFGGDIEPHKEEIDTGVLKGLGCSPGEFSGRARVITDIHKTHQLTKDEILVTFFTDPGWTPVLAKVGGVITEVGGLLSHAAVIGREYGIPAILNLENATKHIEDGDLILMNGKTGVVKILEKGPKG